MVKYMFFFSLIFLKFSACQDVSKASLPTVEVKKEGNHYQLYRNGSPYYIKGAGGHDQLDKLALYGGNSIRTWSTDRADEILDEAEIHGLTVTLGLEVGKEWWGKDFNYWNYRAVDQKIAELKKTVERYKDHPALLMWGIGNEVLLHGGNRFIVLITINKIAKMIHETDPNHPVMTTVPMGNNFKQYGYLRYFIPQVDILGVNAFKRLPEVYGEVRSLTGWNKAYILSEWGPTGPWEAHGTEWGAPLEKSSTDKAVVMNDYLNILKKQKNLCLGGYAFYWGNKYERTYTFFSMFSQEGNEMEAVNFLQTNWSGKTPDNWSPRIDSLIISSKEISQNLYLEADAIYSAKVFAHDPDDDVLTFRWELRPEGKNDGAIGNFSSNLKYLLPQDTLSSIQFYAPAQEGGYRLLVFVYDGYGHVATHNVPFYAVIK